jgi:hypothetical protein
MLAMIVLPVMSLLAPAWFAAIPPWVLWSVPVVTVTAFVSFFAVRPELPPMR